MLRRATSLAEVLVAVSLAGVVLGTASTSVWRQQRSANRVAALSAADQQLRAGGALLPAWVAHADRAAGDIAAAGARDSSLELRAALFSGLTCGGGGASAMLPASHWAGAAHEYDTLWLYRSADTAWHPRAVASVAQAGGVDGCAAGGAVLLGLRPGDSVGAGVLARVTRTVRLSLYRSGDGSWQLGLREPGADGALASPQPLAGPFVRALATGERTAFHYLDADGAEIYPDAYPGTIALLARVRLVMLSARRDTGVAAPSLASVRRDSVEVALGGSAATLAP